VYIYVVLILAEPSILTTKLVKFKSTKQVKEAKDSRSSHDKISVKAAKEIYEHALKLESEYRHYISGVFLLRVYII